MFLSPSPATMYRRTLSVSDQDDHRTVSTESTDTNIMFSRIDSIDFCEWDIFIGSGDRMDRITVDLLSRSEDIFCYIFITKVPIRQF